MKICGATAGSLIVVFFLRPRARVRARPPFSSSIFDPSPVRVPLPAKKIRDENDCVQAARMRIAGRGYKADALLTSVLRPCLLRLTPS